MTSAATTLTPASIIVASWRAKTWSDFGLTFLNFERRPSSPVAPRSESERASRPRAWSSSVAAIVSGAWMTPELSSPWALIASYVNAAISLPL